MTVEKNTTPNQGELAAWLAEFDFGGNSETRALRLRAVEAFATSVGASDIEELVRMAFSTKEQPSTQFVERFRLAFRADDANFPTYGNDREMVVLAGMTIFSIMSRAPSFMSARCALSVFTASVDGARSHSLPHDLPRHAEACLIRISEANRSRPDLSKFANPAVDPNAAAAQAIEAITDATVNAVTIKAALTATLNVTQSASKQIETMFYAAGMFIQQQDEELQILWWLLGARAEGFDCNFEDIPADSKSLVLATELADHTTLLPGPLSIKSLLSHAGLRDGKKVVLSTVLAAAQVDWLRKLVAGQTISPILHPIHFAIERQLENGEGKEWVKSWANRAGIAEGVSFTPLDLAVLIYRERLLLKAASGKLL